MYTSDKQQDPKPDQTKDANCGVSSTFNNSVGVIAVIAAGVIGYFVCQFFVG